MGKSYPFAINVRVRVRNEFWAKRTRACDVRAAENPVCECACVRGKKSSQLTDCELYKQFAKDNPKEADEGTLKMIEEFERQLAEGDIKPWEEIKLKVEKPLSIV